MESSLSSHASSEFENDVRNEEANLSEETEEHADTLTGPPTKKQRLGAQFAYRSTAAAAPTEDLGEISSDTSGSVPGSPLPSGITPEDDMQEQVTVCHWKGCDVGDCANMDNLVTHVHDDHIGVRQKKYACEWVGCARFGAQHASGYALRAHMRSHTREKPFFCALPGRFFKCSFSTLGCSNEPRVRQIIHTIGCTCEAYADCTRNRSTTAI